MQYENMIVEASDAQLARTEDKRRLVRFKVRVLMSPAGEMRPDEALAIEYDDRQLQSRLRQLESRGLDGPGMIALGRELAQPRLRQLESRGLDGPGMIALGRELAQLLLPPKPVGVATGLRELFIASLAQIGPDRGLRLRLRLPPLLAALPWEYVYLDRAGGGEGMDGFLALDPRVAIVRHESLPAPAPLPVVSGSIKIVAALASAAGLPQLDLAKEQADLKQSIEGQAGLTPVFLEDATLDDVLSAIPGAGVFHFAGHGAFTQQMGDLLDTYTSSGALALDDVRVDAEQLGVNLRGNGVRLAVLGGCETGRRDGVSVWSGIAPALVKAEVPAVVANQFSIKDACAIAFSKHFYQALVGGLPIERAVSAGRIAAYNADPQGRDWGVAVLYLRAADGYLFGGASDDAVRRQAAESAQAIVQPMVQANIYIAGPVNTGGGDFVGGNKTVYGDEVHGDKIVNNFSQSEQELLRTFVSNAVAKYNSGLFNDLNQFDLPSEPYKFLDHYTLADTAIFLGRGHAADQLYQTVFKPDARITVLHAPSGTGKSSLLRAGLAARVIKAARGHIPVIVRCGTNPGESFKREIASKALKDGERVPPRWPDLTLRHIIGLVTSDGNLPKRAELVLVLDQFEDLFTLLPPAELQVQIDDLVDCMSDSALPLRVVFSIRKEFFADLARLEPRLPRIIRNQFPLEPMDVEDVKKAIVEPVERLLNGITYEDRLVEMLRDEWRKGQFGLPELQIICKYVYDKTITDRRLQITYESYRLAGGYQGILQGYIDRALDQRFVEVNKRQAAWGVLEALLGGSDQRPIVARQELSLQVGIGSPLLSEILDELLAARLIKREDHDHYTLAQDYMTSAVYDHLRRSSARLEVKRLRAQLQRDVEAWLADRSLISRERLEELHPKWVSLGALNENTILCVLLSTAWAGLGVRAWANRVQPHMLDRIVADLTGTDSRMRCQAARALGALGQPTTIDALTAALTAVSDDESRQEIARALGAVPGTLDQLINLLRDSAENSAIQRVIAPVLGKLGDQRAVEPLMKIVEASTDEGVWAAVAQALAQLGHVQAIGPLCAALRKSRSDQARTEIGSALKDLRDRVLTQEEPLDELLDILKSRQAHLLAQRDFYGELFVNIPVLMDLDELGTEIEQREASLKEISISRQPIDEPQMRIFLLNAHLMDLLGDIGDLQEVIELALVALECDQQAQHDALAVLVSQIQPEELDSVRELIRSKKRLLWRLEQTLARYGTDVEFGIVAQMRDLASEVQTLLDRLNPVEETLRKQGARIASAVLELVPHVEQAADRALIVKILSALGSTASEPIVNMLQGQVDAPIRSILIEALNTYAQRTAEDRDLLLQEGAHRAEMMTIYSRTLTYLEQRAAAYGHTKSFSAPISLLNEIQQAESEIEGLDRRLETLSEAATEDRAELKELQAIYAKRLRLMKERQSKFEEPQESTWLDREMDAVKQPLAQNAAGLQMVEAMSSQFEESVVIPFATILQQVPNAAFEQMISIALVRLGRLEWLPLTSIVAVVATSVSEQLAVLLRRVHPRSVKHLFPKVLRSVEHLKSQMYNIHSAVEQLLDISQNSAIPVTLDQSVFEKAALLAAEAFIAVLDCRAVYTDFEDLHFLEALVSLDSLRFISLTSDPMSTSDAGQVAIVKLAQVQVSLALEQARDKLSLVQSFQEEQRWTVMRRLGALEQRQAQYGLEAQSYVVIEIDDLKSELQHFDIELQNITSNISLAEDAIAAVFSLSTP
jgi:HEAT repeat protein